jgi:hypothetical protein
VRRRNASERERGYVPCILYRKSGEKVSLPKHGCISGQCDGVGPWGGDVVYAQSNKLTRGPSELV